MEGKHLPVYKNAAFDKGLGINPVTNIMAQKLRAVLNHTPGGCEDPSRSVNPSPLAAGLLLHPSNFIRLG